MRIAIYHNLPHGGAHRVMQEQANRLGAAVCDIYTVTANSADNAEFSVPFRERNRLRSPFGRLNGAISIANMREVARANRAIAAQIDSRGYDVVLVHPCRVTQTPPILQYLSTPCLYYCHEPFRAMHEAVIKGGPFLELRDPLRCLYERKAVLNEYDSLRAVDRILCNSLFCREYILRAYGLDSSVNYLGVDTDVFRPSSRPRGDYVLSVGRLSFLKGHDFVIRSLGRMSAQYRPRLVIVGDGPESEIEALSTAASNAGVNLTFCNGIDDKELVELYGCSICTVVAPVLEPFGLVALESMACGTPVVAVAEGGLKEAIVDGVTGFLVHQRDSAWLAQKVELLVRNPGLVSDMETNCRKHVLDHWNWDKSISELRSLLAETAERR